jgi:hypothetical protein
VHNYFLRHPTQLKGGDSDGKSKGKEGSCKEAGKEGSCEEEEVTPALATPQS